VPKQKTPRQPKPLCRRKRAKPSGDNTVPATPNSLAHFELREDGAMAVEGGDEKRPPVLTLSDPARSLWLYHGNRNHSVGGEKREKQTRLQLSGDAQSQRQTDENRVSARRISR